MALPTATLATRKRAMLLGAGFIEDDLRKLRQQVAQGEEGTWEGGGPREGHQAIPATTSHEGDVLKAMEWASAITWLRALAEQEPS